MSLRVRVVRTSAAGVTETRLDLPPGATLADALIAAGVKEPDAPAGVFGQLRPRDTRLRDGDRVEVYRALVNDPRAARRARALRKK